MQRLVRDESGDWFVIPADMKKKWERFKHSAAAENGDIPDYAKNIEDPRQYIFTSLEYAGY